MIMPDFKNFPQTGRILAVDWGQRRVGLAVCDESREFFFTRPQIENKSDFRAVAAVVNDAAASEKAVGIIVGLPRRTDGSESETTISVRRFADDLAGCTDLPIAFVDESLTSAAAAEALIGVRRGDLKRNLDSESARIILENAVAMIKRTQNA
jgi:putative Holliday junction resolvase